MSGPIVRSGPSPEFSKNWESIFGKAKKKPAEQPAKEAPAKSPAKGKKKK
jgi:hypothetical protein